MSPSLGMHVPLPSSSPCNGMSWNGDHIPTLERDFCSNFTCCGRSLGDLHELIDHFEEAHVIVIGPDGSSIYPVSQTGLSDRTPTPYCAAAPFSKVVFEDHRSWISEAVSDPFRIIPAKLAVPETAALVADFDVISEKWTNLSADQLCLPPSSFTADTDVDAERDGHSSYLPLRTEKKRQRGNVGSRRRDKSHKCPRPGCTKSYLNPNGLKYHLEKGTCSIDPTFHRDPLRANCKDPFLVPE
ncbi:hypothetical protein PAXRUDRAFT_221369 [Paxillus rubicundulus Ve08.2h10]|uniref:C2H2-type domain-containing protein n=1 Tax=Paxillus rubicundulus Ve08.2h10 TaxID=930991 RepID=A0A0D0DH79_9AGAM|nr:hypothetical protein PAXRUDRAFT_221369 [Paxillus rubicundulus Ve08.2h10]